MTREDKLRICDMLLTAPTPEDHEERLRLAQLVRDGARRDTNVGPHRIEWGEEAVARVGKVLYSALARNSYIARVTLSPSNRVVLVVLPPDARRDGTSGWVLRVLAAAELASDGAVVVLP